MAAPKMTTDFREAAAVWATGRGNSFSLHVGDPGTTGANEITGGTYARKPTTWTAGVVDGSVSGSEVEFDIPGPVAPATKVVPTHLGCWSGSTFQWAVPIANIEYPGPSKVRVTVNFSTPQG